MDRCGDFNSRQYFRNSWTIFMVVNEIPFSYVVIYFQFSHFKSLNISIFENVKSEDILQLLHHLQQNFNN